MRKVLTVSILAALAVVGAGCRSKKPAESGPAASDARRVANVATSRRVVEPVPMPAAPAATDGSAAKDTRPVLVCFGDSLTAGYGTEPGQSYPEYLQAELDRMHYRYRVVNEGISGNTTKDGRDRVADVVALHPAIVVVEFGGNDGLRGLHIEDTRRNLEQIVMVLKATGAKVVLAGITLPPDYGPDYVKQFDETYTTIAKRYDVPMIPFLLKGVYGVPGMMQKDATHATAKGNKIVAKNVLGLIQPYLKKG